MDTVLNDDDIIIFKDEEINDDYHTWIKDGEDYFPATNLQLVNKLPNGIYRVVIDDSKGYKLVNVSINTDELYSFPEDLTTTIYNETKNFWDSEKIYNKYNISHRRGILLYGNPGCGKTSIVSLLSKQLIEKDGLIFFVSNSKDFINLSDALQFIIRKIEPDRPIITIIEDVDQIIEELGGDYQLLNFLDGNNSINKHLVVFTSNNTSDLSSALLRPSRIDLIYEIPYPNEKIRKEYFKKKGIDPSLLDEYAMATEDLSFAELKEVFIGTQIFKKSLDEIIHQLKTPFEHKDYLNKTTEIKGLI